MARENDQNRQRNRRRDISLPPGLKNAVCGAIFSRSVPCRRCNQNIRRRDFERHVLDCGGSNGQRPEAA